MRRFLLLLALAGMMVTSSSPSFAQAATEAQAPEVPLWRQITADGYASLSYSYNENTPSPRINQFRVFDFNDDEPQLDVAELVIQRAVSKPKQFGFRFDLLAGSGVPEVTAAYGLFRNRGTRLAHHVDIAQLYVRYVAPIGGGVSIDVGKFTTHMGYEVIGGYDGYNDNFSRGFIFGYGIPFTHTGARASYTFNRRINAMVSVTNGWDDVQSLNHGYTWGAQVNLNTTKSTVVSFNFIHGPEKLNNANDQRSAGEIVATWKATPKLSLAMDALYGHEENGVAPGADAIWRGFAGYAKYAVTQRFFLALRGERFRDGGGTRTGVDQALNGFTFSPEYDFDTKWFSRFDARLKRLDGRLALRGEVRVDTSNRGVFHTNSATVREGQLTTAANLVYAF